MQFKVFNITDSGTVKFGKKNAVFITITIDVHLPQKKFFMTRYM